MTALPDYKLCIRLHWFFVGIVLPPPPSLGRPYYYRKLWVWLLVWHVIFRYCRQGWGRDIWGKEGNTACLEVILRRSFSIFEGNQGGRETEERQLFAEGDCASDIFLRETNIQPPTHHCISQGWLPAPRRQVHTHLPPPPPPREVVPFILTLPPFPPHVSPPPPPSYIGLTNLYENLNNIAAVFSRQTCKFSNRQISSAKFQS